MNLKPKWQCIPTTSDKCSRNSVYVLQTSLYIAGRHSFPICKRRHLEPQARLAAIVEKQHAYTVVFSPSSQKFLVVTVIYLGNTGSKFKRDICRKLFTCSNK